MAAKKKEAKTISMFGATLVLSADLKPIPLYIWPLDQSFQVMA
jgi:hypothetical protein